MSGRWRNPLVFRRRRFEVLSVPLTPVVPQCPPTLTTTTYRYQGRLRRGKTFETPSIAQIVGVAPPFVADMLARAPRSISARFRRTPPLAVAGVAFVPDALQHPVRLPSVRRTRFSLPPWPQEVAPASPFVPDPVQRSVRPPGARRGRFAFLPWVQQLAATPPVFVPDQTQRPVRVLIVRRGRFALPPWPQQQAATPPAIPPNVIQRRAQRLRFSRRGAIIQSRPVVVTLAPSLVPPKVSRRSRGPAFWRHGRFLSVPFSAAVVIDPGFICQDFATTAMVDTDSAVATIDSYTASMTVDGYTVTFTVDQYNATATICGR